VKLTSRQTELLDNLAAGAMPLSGMFFRAVEFRWMHPDDVMSGGGAAKLGGRFAAIGTRALYVSDSEETLLQEIAERKARLGGKALVDLDKYPRVTFRIDLKMERHISFAEPPRHKRLNGIRHECLRRDSLVASQAVGRYLAGLGVQAIRYPSVAGSGTNVVVFVENTRHGEVVLFNRMKVIDQIAKFGLRRPK
jgi:RES domain-containing protein